MVGDEINDTPAFSQSHLNFAVVDAGEDLIFRLPRSSVMSSASARCRGHTDPGLRISAQHSGQALKQKNGCRF